MLEESTTEFVTLVNDTSLVSHVSNIDDTLTTLTALVFIFIVVAGAYLINRIIYHVLSKFT